MKLSSSNRPPVGIGIKVQVYLRGAAALAALLVVAGLCVATSPVRGQSFPFHHLSVDDGLSQSVVHCILQDSEGFLWIGTQDGLNRFDGYLFQVLVHHPDEPDSLSNNWIYGLAEDRQGRIWVATRGGVNLFDKSTGKFTAYRHDPSDPDSIASDVVYGIAVDESGRILANTAPVLSVLDPAEGEKWKRIESPLAASSVGEDLPLPILVAPDGAVWMAGVDGLAVWRPRQGVFDLVRPEPAAGASRPSGALSVRALFGDQAGSIWIGTRAGLYRSLPDDPLRARRAGAFREPGNRSVGELLSGSIRAIQRDRQGRLWVGFDGNGLASFSLDGEGTPWNLLSFRQNSLRQDGLSHDIVIALGLDRSDNLWIGTLKGLDRIDLKPRKFRVYRRSSDPDSWPLSDNVIASLFKDRQGRVWVGTWGRGLDILDRRTRTSTHYAAALAPPRRISNDFVHVIFEDRSGTIWLGTRNGLDVYRAAREDFVSARTLYPNRSFPDFTGIRIYSMLQDTADRLWVGTGAGLFRLDPKRGEFLHLTSGEGAKSLTDNVIYALALDPAGQIWAGTSNGLNRIDPESGSVIRILRDSTHPSTLCDNFVVSLCVDHLGALWIGTKSGVNRLPPNRGLFDYFSAREGLPSNIIYEILEDPEQGLWFSTGRGLAELRPGSSRFRSYSVDDGLQSLEFNLKASCLSPDGEIFFGGMNGFNSFYLGDLRDNSSIPPVVLTGVEKETPRGRVRVDPHGAETLTLRPTERTFTVEFAALEFSNPARNQYAYRMDGLSDDWVELGTRRFVTFSKLPPGEYRLRVKGSNNDGVWNEEGAALNIVVLPAWWQSNRAIAGYVVLGLVALFLTIRTRDRRLKRRNAAEEELRLATAIQARLLPQGPPVVPGYDFAGLTIPASRVGGDYFDFIALGKGKEGICVGDVSGKGLPAALLMANVQAIVRSHARTETELSTWLERVNDQVCENTASGQFVTLFYAVLDTVKHRLEFSNAGHNPPLLLRRNSRLERLIEGGPALGLFAGRKYEAQELQLHAGDLLVLYSDGITEAFSQAGEEFGESGIISAVQSLPPTGSAADGVELILAAVRKHLDGRPPHDDITLVVVRRTWSS